MYFNTQQERDEMKAARRARATSLHRMDAPMLHRDDSAESAASPNSRDGAIASRRKSVTKAGGLTFVEPARRSSISTMPSSHLGANADSLRGARSNSYFSRDSTITDGTDGGPSATPKSGLAFLAQLPPVVPADATNMNDDLDLLLTQLTERETLHACDVLEAMLEDEEGGFHEELFLYCKKYIHNAKEYDRKNGTQIVDFDVAAATEIERDVQAELLVYDTLPIARKVKIFLEHPESGPWARAFYAFLSFVVVLSCTFTVVMTLPQWNPNVFPEYSTMWTASDWCFTGLLSLETLVRFIANVLDERQGRKTANAISFLRKPGNIADIVALSPTYVQVILSSAGRVLSGTLRTARLLRLLKFLRRYQPVRRLVQALARSVGGLIAPFCFLAMSLLLFASTVFYAERGDYDEARAMFMVPDPTCANQPVEYLNGTAACPLIESKFISVAQALWWGIVSMSTNGYGDLVPVTDWGRAVASVSMICGVVFVAMPIAVIGANYTFVVEQSKTTRKQSLEERVMRLQEAGVDAFKLRMPGESLVNAVKHHLSNPVVDLRAPTPESLYVIDTVLEACLKEMVNALRVSDGEPAPFAQGALPLWHATIPTPKPKPSPIGGGRSMLGRSFASASIVDTPTNKAVGTSNDKLLSVVLSRPTVIRLGASQMAGSGGGGSMASAAVGAAAHFIDDSDVTYAEVEGPPGGAGGESFSAIYSPRLHDAIAAAARPPTARPNDMVTLPLFAISQRHATVVAMRSWGEVVPLLYTEDASPVYTVVMDSTPDGGDGAMLTEVSVKSAWAISLEARQHLQTLQQKRADKMLRKMRGSSAFAQRRREQVEDDIIKSLQFDSSKAKFTFDFDRTQHWMNMEQHPLQLRSGTVLQFGDSVDMALSTEAWLDTEQRVLAPPTLATRRIGLWYQFVDNAAV